LEEKGPREFGRIVADGIESRIMAGGKDAMK
jgi:hypothetical protein